MLVAVLSVIYRLVECIDINTGINNTGSIALAPVIDIERMIWHVYTSLFPMSLNR